MISTLRTSILGLSCATLLGGCSSLDVLGVFDKDEVRLDGDRVAVRKTNAETNTVSSDITIALPRAVSNSEWPQFNGNAARSIGHVASPGSLQQAWRVSAGSGSGGRVVASPIVADGRVYTMDAESTVSALDASSGAEIWSVDLTPDSENAIDGFGGGLAAENGRLYVSSGFGFLAALDAASGAEIWKSFMRAPSRSAPAIAGGRVFAVTRENRIFAFDTETGEADWDSSGLEQTAGILGGAGPAATDEVVVAPYSSGELVAYIASSGRTIWEDDLTGIRGAGGVAALTDVTGDPVIADNVVYAASQAGRLVAIDLRGGERVWTRNISSTQAPYVAGNAVFVVSDGGDLYALDRETGDTAWRVPLGGFEDPDDREEPIVWAGPIAAGNRLLLTSSTERLIAVDPTNGIIVAETSLSDGSSLPPIVANGTIYVLTDDADLLAFR